MVIALPFFFLASLAVIFAFFFGDQYHHILAVALIPSMLCSFAVILKRQNDLFSPFQMIFFMSFLGVFLKAFYLIYLDYEGNGQNIALAGKDLEILVSGANLISLGVLSALMGMLIIPLPKKSSSVDLISTFSIERTRLFAFIALCIGGALFIVFFNKLGLGEALGKGIFSAKRVHLDTVGNAPRGASFGYLRMGAQTLPQVALFIHLVSMKLHRPEIKFVDYILVVGLSFFGLALPFLTSSRLEMLYMFLIILIIYHYAFKQVTIFRASVVALVMVIALTALGQLRSQSNPRYKGEHGISLGVSKVLEATLGRGYFMGLDKTAVIVDEVPSRVDYLYGKSLYLFFLGPIPRTLWPEKPAIRIGLFVGQEIYGRNNNSGVPPGLIAELYMNYGKIAVALGMFIFGIGYAILYRMTVLTRLSPFRIIIYSIGTLIMSFSLLTGDFTFAMSQVFRYGLCFLFGYVIISHVSRRQRYSIP